MSKDILKRVDINVCIPPKGKKELIKQYPFNVVNSVNPAVSAGIILSQLIKI